jgi:arylsulfatase A-like enzyme
MTARPTPPGPRGSLLPGWVLAAALSTALCAGILDLGLSLWREMPAGLGSGAALLLVPAVTAVTALAAFLAGFVLLRSALRPAPVPLALSLASSLLLGLLLVSVARSLDPVAADGMKLLLGGLAAATAVLVYFAVQAVPGLAQRRTFWMRAAVAAPLLGSAVLLALWLARYRQPAVAGPLPAPVTTEPARHEGDRLPQRIVLLSIDTLRAGELPTPHLDRLAGDAVRFTHAYSSASWTLPAMASVMTGLSPEVHRAVHSHSRVPDGVLTLAEVLRRAGYRTAALVSSPILNPAVNLAQGFDEYTAFPGPWIGRSFGAGVLTSLVKAFRPEEAPPPEIADLATGWLRAHRQGDFFLWVHFFDPHAPYGPPREYLAGAAPPPGAKWRFEGWDEDAIRAGTWVPSTAERAWIHQLYLGEVRYVDAAVGRVTAELRRLGMYDDALVVVTSDHGEEFWEHGAYGHGHTLYDELLHVPLLVKLPKGGRRGRVDAPVSTASLASTILGVAGAPLPAGYPAAAPLPLAAGERPAGPLFSLGLNRFEDRRAVRFEHWKYVRWDLTGREELYDLAADPGETHDLAPHAPGELIAGRALLAGFAAQGREARRLLRLGESENATLDEGTLARLRALGYVR